MRNLVFTILASLACSSSMAFHEDLPRARPNWYKPDFFPVQFAGDIGFLSTGIGYHSKKGNYQLAIMYGYSPKSITLSTIHKIAAKNVFHLYRFNIHKRKTLYPYLGLAALVETGSVSFLRLPDQYPPKYYIPKGLHASGFGGIKINHPVSSKSISALEFYSEAGATEFLFWYAFSSKQVKLSEVLSVAFGVNVFLRK